MQERNKQMSDHLPRANNSVERPESPSQQTSTDEQLSPVEEIVEKAASAYFQTCRRIARAINRLKE